MTLRSSDGVDLRVTKEGKLVCCGKIKDNNQLLEIVECDIEEPPCCTSPDQSIERSSLMLREVDTQGAGDLLNCGDLKDLLVEITPDYVK